MPEYSLEDLFMAGFDSSFEKTAEESELDLSEMPVFAKLATNLGLVEAGEEVAEENMSMLEKLAFLGFKKATKTRGATAKERISKLIEMMKERAGKAYSKAKETAAKHPKATKALTHGAAAAGGLGLGAILGRASK